jgi:Na+(H+)/acetate symporter ActP
MLALIYAIYVVGKKKKWSYKKKGAIIGILVGVIFSVIAIILMGYVLCTISFFHEISSSSSKPCISNDILMIFAVLPMFASLISVGLMDQLSLPSVMNWPLAVIPMVSFWPLTFSLIGLLVGSVVEKVKSRKGKHHK